MIVGVFISGACEQIVKENEVGDRFALFIEKKASELHFLFRPKRILSMLYSDFRLVLKQD
jgi:hypothetical protein